MYVNAPVLYELILVFFYSLISSKTTIYFSRSLSIFLNLKVTNQSNFTEEQFGNQNSEQLNQL